ncbi:MAG TPA: hypothetical protein VFN23_14400 [Ktedonobacteraceae bacterium]|nr:hypothetical protein [Ktedonobacteraceae bacterium]
MAKSARKSSKKDPASMSFEDAGRQNKKQAKREAKLMLKLSDAKAEVQKAEKRLAKAIVSVQKYETGLEELRQNGRVTLNEEGEVIVTTTAPDSFGEVETQIVEEILEEIMQSTTNQQTENDSENGQHQAQSALGEKPEDASHTSDEDTMEPSLNEGQDKTEKEEQSNADDQEGDTAPHPAIEPHHETAPADN